MTVGILAENIRAGGGLTHLAELLNHWRRGEHGIESLRVWGSPALEARCHPREGLSFESPRGNRATSVLMPGDTPCDVLFVPGGSYLGTHPCYVSMFQNLLPFSPLERRRYGVGRRRFRLGMLRVLQERTFKRAAGLVFLTATARDVILSRLRGYAGRTILVPHGVAERFRRKPVIQPPPESFTVARPMRFLYVSVISRYKHQWHVIEAIARLRRLGAPVVLDLVGAVEPESRARFHAAIERVDRHAEFIRHWGAIDHADLHDTYHNADAFVFASSCENLPNILMEAMAAGLPIASSNRGVMPEVLSDAGVYFDPEAPEEIEAALKRLFDDAALRAELARKAYERSLSYSWSRCAAETFAFLGSLHDESRRTGIVQEAS